MIDFLLVMFFVVFIILQFYMLDERCSWDSARSLQALMDGCPPIFLLGVVGLAAAVASFVVTLVFALVFIMIKPISIFVLTLSLIILALWLTKKFTGAIFTLINKRNSKESNK